MPIDLLSKSNKSSSTISQSEKNGSIDLLSAPTKYGATSVQEVPTQDLNPTNDQTKENPLFKGGIAPVLNAVTSSEQNFGKDIAQAGYLLFGGQKKIDEVTQMHMSNGTRLTDLAKKQTDPTLKSKYAHMAVDEFKQAQGTGESVIGKTRTPEQIVGDALGTGMDALLSGSLNSEAKSFKLLSAADKTALAEKGIKSAIDFSKLSVKQKLAIIGKETLHTAVKGAALGYGMDVSSNLQQNKEGASALKPGWGTALGAAIPLTIGGVKMSSTALLNPENGGRVVNSLIKPLGRDFAYGKNPGKVIAEEGITGNNLDELGSNVKEARQEIGRMLGEKTSAVEGKSSVDLSRALDPIDRAIEEAEKTPQTNKALITRLNAIKSDLGTYIGEDNKYLTFAESIDAKGTIGDLTKWTGNPSDDKIVNKALKQVYGTIDGKTMGSLGKIDSGLQKEIDGLNDKYGSLISAQNAIEHRSQILQRQNLISFTGKVATVTGAIASLVTMNPVPVLAGISEAMLEKAIKSPAVQTRLASWMASESPGVIGKLYKANPAIRNILLKLQKPSN